MFVLLVLCIVVLPVLLTLLQKRGAQSQALGKWCSFNHKWGIGSKIDCSSFSTLCAIVFDNSVLACNGFRTWQTYLRPFVHFVIYISLGSQNRPCHTPYISIYCNCNCNVCNFTTVLPKIHCTGRKAAAVHYSPFFAEFLIWWWWAPFGNSAMHTLPGLVH